MKKSPTVSKAAGTRLPRIPENNTESRKQRKLASAPEVGIFFAVHGQIWIDGTPVNDATAYGLMKTYEKGHYTFWQELQKRNAVPCDEEYDDFPRGRACYDAQNQVFFLFCDKCIREDRDMVNKIIEEMNLPYEPLTRVEPDSHYRCPACIARPIDELDA